MGFTRQALILRPHRAHSLQIIYGTLLWDIDSNDLELRADYLLVEGQGQFHIGTEAAPMLNRATIHIKDSAAAHPILGRRFIAAYVDL